MKTEPNTEPTSDGEEANEIQPSEHTEKERFEPHTGHGASPGKIFIGGLAKETTLDQFQKHFEKYGELTDSVIMKDRKTLQPRGFGFVTYADPSVVDTVIQEPHIINGKQVEIKRTIPKGAIGSKDFKTKKIFVGGLPTTVSEEEFKSFFTKYGEVKENMIMRDHTTSRSRGFGFITFETEEAVDNLLSKGNKIDFGGTQVEIKKAEPKKSGAPPPLSKRHDTKPAYGDAYGGYAAAGDFGVGSYRSGAGMGGRSGAYGGYGGSEFGSGYGGYGGSAVGGYRGDPTLGYSGRYGGGYGRGYDIGGAGAGAGAGAYGGAGEGYGAYGGGVAGGFGGGYDTGLGGGAGYGSNTGAPFYGNRGAGYGGSSGSGGRYHPYSR